MADFLIEHANVTGERWGAWVLAATLDTAALLALVGLLWLAIRSRVAPQVGYCLFLLVPLKLLLPLQITENVLSTGSRKHTIRFTSGR